MKAQIVKEWIERGKHDLEVAKILIAEEEYSDVVLFHIHQAVEKYLKGFLIFKHYPYLKISKPYLAELMCSVDGV